MEKLTDIFGLFASGIGIGVLLSCLFALIGVFVGLFKRIMTCD